MQTQKGLSSLRKNTMGIAPTEDFGGWEMQHQVYVIGKNSTLEETTAAGKINQILRQALEQHASDIHLEPQSEGILVRIRCDGQLNVLLRLEGPMSQLVSNRLKIMAELDTTERRLPQDGHLTINWNGTIYDIRVSSLPLFQGERFVLRILGQRDRFLSLDQLGFSEKNLQLVKMMLRIPHGMLLLCGPTGSGKTTTLYSMLAVLRETGKNIVTLEDPVEYEMEGINQVQINEKTGLTFARGLRSLLRQDPDILMVGEIRDLESAEIAIRLAYTGHLVLASLHTNDAIGAIHRLVELGVPSHLLASCLNGVIAQRLVRCLQGNQWKGRIAIQEVLFCHAKMRQWLTQYDVFLERQEELRQENTSLWEDGKEKAAAGKTTLEELMAVLGPEV